MNKSNLRKVNIISIVVLILIFILDIINVSDIIKLPFPFSNLSLELWNILVVIVLYIITYEIIDKRDNRRKQNQEEVAKILLEQSYQSCIQYMNMIDSVEFKKICPKRFPGDQTMENNSAYHKMRVAPFENDLNIFALGEAGVISASNISNYLIVKSKYSIYLSNVVCFPEVDQMTDSLKVDLKNAISRATENLF